MPRACSWGVCAHPAAPTYQRDPQFPHWVQDPWKGGAGAAKEPRLTPHLRSSSLPPLPHSKARKVLEARTGEWGRGGKGATVAGTRRKGRLGPSGASDNGPGGQAGTLLGPRTAPAPGHGRGDHGRSPAAPSLPVPHVAEPKSHTAHRWDKGPGKVASLGPHLGSWAHRPPGEDPRGGSETHRPLLPGGVHPRGHLGPPQYQRHPGLWPVSERVQPRPQSPEGLG